jgi:hypothetical protein
MRLPSPPTAAMNWRAGSRRGAARLTARDGFEGFELLRPADDRTTWLVAS